LVLAAPTARFTQAFVRIGLAPDMGSLFLLPRRVGFQAARELMLTGREVAGEEARDLGLVDELCEQQDLWTRARAIAEERANGPLAAYAAIKQGVARGTTASLRDSLAIEAALQLDLLAGPDFAEGSRAFLEKRPPVFHRNHGSGAASE
jgi:2-(1,2-epoxy-1,2-dihydrophenyl)acetyl-CoA isomerase